MKILKSMVLAIFIPLFISSTPTIANEKKVNLGVLYQFSLVLGSDNKDIDGSGTLLSASVLGTFLEYHPVKNINLQLRGTYNHFSHDGLEAKTHVQETWDTTGKIFTLSFNAGYDLLLIDSVELFILGGYGFQKGTIKDVVSQRSLYFGNTKFERQKTQTDDYWFGESGMKILFESKKIYYELIVSFKLDNFFDHIDFNHIFGTLNIRFCARI